jgi:hypothetical protein
MSGGTFQYKEHILDNLADEIIYATEDLINEPEAKKLARRLATRLRKLRLEVKALDYYLAGDTSSL